jgi:hypothetical protein
MTVEDRLSKLERRISTYRNLSMLMAALLLLVTGIAATPSGDAMHDELRTRRLVIVDDADREAASLKSYGNTTALQIGGDRDGIRMEHGPRTNAIQLITVAHRPVEGNEGFQTNGLTLYVDRFKSGMFIINPGQGDTFTSHGRIWLDSERGFEMSREMFAPSRVFTTFKPVQ